MMTGTTQFALRLLVEVFAKRTADAVSAPGIGNFLLGLE
jgi:hypothetical protein